MNDKQFKNHTKYIIPYAVNNKFLFKNKLFVESDIFEALGEIYLDLKFSISASKYEYNKLVYFLNKENNLYGIYLRPTYLLARFKIQPGFDITASLIKQFGDRFISKDMVIKTYEFFHS